MTGPVLARLALLRHGHTAWNRAGRIQGCTDEPLDDETRHHLAGLRLPDGFAGAAVLSSPLRRAVETARLLTGHDPVIVPELAEMNWGEWEGRCGIDLLEDHNSGYRHIEDWGWDFQPPGGETPRSVWARLQPWLGTVSGQNVVVSHMGIMRVLLAKATGWNFKGSPPFKVKRDRLYRVTVHDDGTLSHDSDPIRLVPATGS